MNLSRSQVSGTFAISSSAPYTAGVRIPNGAQCPAQVSVKNGHASAVLYCKWVPLTLTNPNISTGDAGVTLLPYEGYTWDSPPAGAALLILSTVNGSPAHIEGVWAMPQEAQI